MLVKRSSAKTTGNKRSGLVAALADSLEPGVSRRGFLRRSGLAAGGIAAVGALPGAMIRKAEAGPILPNVEVVTRKNVCTHCSVGCTVIAEVQNGVWVGQEPGWESPINQGTHCAKGASVRELTKGNAEGLVPLLAFYTNLYADQLQRKRYYLSAHAREMVFGLADHYADRARSPASRALAGRFLAAFGAEIARQTGTGGMSQRAFTRALALDEANETTRLCLAIESERRGDYKEAIAYLRRLVELHPESAEARLRLAINVSRVSREKEAEQLLAGLTHASVRPAPWVELVAYQELARLQLTLGRAKEAEKTVRAGLAAFPRDQKLLFQLALLLDLRGEDGDAQSALAELSPQAQGDGVRYRYTELPDGLKEPLATGLEKDVRDRLPVLASALGGTQPPAVGGGK